MSPLFVEKIDIVKNERDEIISYGEKMQKLAMQSLSSSKYSVSSDKPTSTALEMVSYISVILPL